MTRCPTDTGANDLHSALADDAISKRLLKGLLVSIFANALLWAGAAGVVRYTPRHDFKTVMVQRVIIDKQGHVTQKVVKKEDIQKKVTQIKKAIVEEERKQRTAPPPPQGAHNKILTVVPTKNSPVEPNDTNTVLGGGNAAVGQAISGQHEGNATQNPPTPPPPAPTPAPAPPPPPPPPPIVQQATPPVAAPTPPPAPQGPTKAAEAISTPYPEIPDELKQQDYKSFVRVKVIVEADGSFSVVLRTSSGNAEIDKRVLNALHRWKWKPALQDGTPVESTQLFRFEFEVQ